MKFVDLFAGLGGFHSGMSSAGFECVFASELDPELRELYEFNHGLRGWGDIRKVRENNIPEHDVLCAGFPCQPFSLAGSKKGTECPISGRLIDEVLRIAKHRRPEFLILENVPNVLTIANGSFWQYINTAFEQLGYKLIHKIISPEDVGIPQNRRRLFIVGSLNHDLLESFEWPKLRNRKSLLDILDDSLPHKVIEPMKRAQLMKWQQLLSTCNLLEEMPSLSISAQEFGATYPIDFSNLTIEDLRGYKGAYGKNLCDCRTWNDVLSKMPSYCRKTKQVPRWLIKSVDYSRNIYRGNIKFLDEWCKDFDKQHNSWQTLEWRGYKTKRLLRDHLLQFRASGIRVMKPRKAPSLIAMTATQVPIIGWEMRYMSKYEAAKLQNLHGLTKIPSNDFHAFKAFGNAVNAKIVELIALNIKRIKLNRSVQGVCYDK